MILGGGLITQALAGGGSSGGGKVKPLSVTENGTYNVSEAEKAEGYTGYCPVTVDVPQSCLNMCDLFEQQTPITTISFFGDYSAKLCIMPDGTYYNRYRYYQGAGYSPGEDSPPFVSQDVQQKDFCCGIYRGTTLLYLNYINTAQSKVIYKSWDSSENKVYTSGIYTYEWEDASKIVANKNLQPMGYNCTLQYPYNYRQITYNVNGEITGDYTGTGTTYIGCNLTASNCYYTRFKGNDLTNQMDLIINDIYAEYLRTQAT